MPRNDIATIIGLIVSAWYIFAGPGRAAGWRSTRAIGDALLAFVVAFAIAWIGLRVMGH